MSLMQIAAEATNESFIDKYKFASVCSCNFDIYYRIYSIFKNYKMGKTLLLEQRKYGSNIKNNFYVVPFYFHIDFIVWEYWQIIIVEITPSKSTLSVLTRIPYLKVPILQIRAFWRFYFFLVNPNLNLSHFCPLQSSCNMLKRTNRNLNA